ncbi:hypothetical protein [Vibrio aestuarianus]|uniref:hypothetical protein n=1 Tax=Vibrio aestuarianus TaxID=28171 RepID=UPI00237D110D|nr:hypothetical protein [Vibrio aestuarianus]MDE1237834.1 hypothetical protein [Vibrio aestuarianus]
MIKPVILVSTALFSGLVAAQPLSGSACVPDSGNKINDETIAKALAKGQLAHELGSLVDARTVLTTITTESIDNIATTDVITEEVKLSSSHKLRRISTVSHGYVVQNGTRTYCVTLTQD